MNRGEATVDDDERKWLVLGLGIKYHLEFTTG